MKLHKEKETLLGAKLLEARTPDKKTQKTQKRNQKLKAFINTTSTLIAGVLMVLVTVEGYKNVLKHKHFSSSVTNMKDIIFGLIERITAIVKMKTILTFPSLEHYLYSINSVSLTEMLPKIFIGNDIENIITLTQEILGGFVCLIQIVGHIGSINDMKYTIIIDLLWSVFVITSIVHRPTDIDPVFISIVKVRCYNFNPFMANITIVILFEKMHSCIPLSRCFL